MTTQLEQDFPCYEPDELAAVSALTAEDVEAIDLALLQHSAGGWQKVAMIVVGAMYAYPTVTKTSPTITTGVVSWSWSVLGVLRRRATWHPCERVKFGSRPAKLGPNNSSKPTPLRGAA